MSDTIPTKRFSLVETTCKNCKGIKEKELPSNFCSEDCFNEWMGKEIASWNAMVYSGISIQMGS